MPVSPSTLAAMRAANNAARQKAQLANPRGIRAYSSLAPRPTPIFTPPPAQKYTISYGPDTKPFVADAVTGQKLDNVSLSKAQSDIRVQAQYAAQVANPYGTNPPADHIFKSEQADPITRCSEVGTTRTVSSLEQGSSLATPCPGSTWQLVRSEPARQVINSGQIATSANTSDLGCAPGFPGTSVGASYTYKLVTTSVAAYHTPQQGVIGNANPETSYLNQLVAGNGM